MTTETWILVVYVAPTIVAALRNHRSAGGILVLNMMLGWTIIGWILALIWACADTGQRRAR